jgi:hypothetical protein
MRYMKRTFSSSLGIVVAWMGSGRFAGLGVETRDERGRVERVVEEWKEKGKERGRWSREPDL